MAEPTEIVLVGTSHRVAPAARREGCAVAPESTGEALRRLVAEEPAVTEAWLLSTCNRTEVAVAASDPDLACERVTQRFFAGMEATHTYAHHATDAVFHLFRVGAGLDSQVLGESQILAQIKDATERARSATALGRVLTPLVEQALVVGKRVRTETKVGEGTLSVARAGVSLARKVLGPLDGARVLLIGAGETGLLAAEHLVAVADQPQLVFANRTLARGEEAALRFGGRAVGLDALHAEFPEADLTIVCVDAPEPVLRPEHVDRSRLRRRDRMPLVIDLSIPRAVSSKLEDDADLMVHDVDALEAIVAHHRRERRAEIESAEGILVAEVHKFLALRTYARMKPLVTGLEERFSVIREEVLDASGRTSRDEDRRLVEKLTRRLLAEARTQLKEAARHAWSEGHLEARYRGHREAFGEEGEARDGR